jgi:hypothetical protein
MTRKKTVVVLGSTIVVIGLLTSVALAQSVPSIQRIIHPVAVQYKENPAPVVKANEPSAKFLSKEQIEAKAFRDKGGKPIKTESITWGTFMQNYDSSNKDSQIDPARKVWVVQTYYPDGFETKAGIMKNALVTGVYDAETGDVIGVLHKSLPNGQSPSTP